jgi:hypothetical protein
MTPLFYPPHPPRRASGAYRRVHARLVVEEGRGCAVCGVTHAVIRSPRARRDPKKNPWRASAIETHHAVVEWALMNAVDVRRFNAVVVARMRGRPGADRIYAHRFTRTRMRAWIDHHPDNLMVLSDVHHRHSKVGIHSVAAPLWRVQPLLNARAWKRLVREAGT